MAENTNAQTQREELHKTIWNIADSLRGAIDGWEFKSYILCSIFYRYISENLCNYINKLQFDAGVEGFDFAKLSDEEANDEGVKNQMVAEKGYYILPSQLFVNVARKAAEDDNLNETLSKVFAAIEATAQGTPSEDAFKGLFSDFAVNNSQLGNSVSKRNELIAKVLVAIRDLDLGSTFEDHSIDAFGDAYEFLMKMYASGAGKSGGEFFTPQEVSEILARIVMLGQKNLKTIYDPACGSGSLLLKAAKLAPNKEDLHFYGQEINPTTYNLCRINMFLHNINFANFDIQLEDTLHKPQHLGMRFDGIVSNPPYSIPWDGDANAILINDERYAPAGVLAPKTKADLAFTMHMLYHLAETGTAAIVEFPGVLYRGGAEKQIRKYLVDNNYVDAIIQLPANLFFGVSIATCIIVLKKSAKKDNSILFLDASNLFKKEGNKNRMMPEHQDAVVNAIADRKDEQYFTKLVPCDDVAKNDYNLSVSSYVEKEVIKEEIDIEKVNADINDLMAKAVKLNDEINKIIAEL
ncbi:MAG: type I restriction-modification system subunit M [Paludibacteraceae bacterium]|nr:type I restriction-modification system subunit M [Paludibacteraceae bacterium]